MTPETDGRYLHLRGATGRVTEANGRLTVPVVALVGDSVIWAVNAPHAEFVPIATLSSETDRWISKPVVLGHPSKNGRQISANSPEVLEKHGFGEIADAHIKNNKLCVNASIDIARAEQLGGAKFLQQLRDGVPCEVSVGAFVQTSETTGNHQGKNYKARWETLNPDHLAFLPTSKGACSIEAGCGSHRAATTYLVTAEGMEEIKLSWKDRLITLFAKFYDDDCSVCQGSGSVDGNPCTACDGPQVTSAAGARHSGNDLHMIQTVHDHSVDLGAKCARDYKAMEYTPLVKDNVIITTPEHSCNCHKGADRMAEETKVEPIVEVAKEVVDVKAIEEAKETALKAVVEAEGKVVAAEARAIAAEAKLKVAESQAIPAEELNELRSLAAEKRAQDAVQKATLVAQLTTAAAGIFTEEELGAKSIPDLLKLAQIAKIDEPKPNYSGKAVPRVASEHTYEAPDPYADSIKAMQSRVN